MAKLQGVWTGQRGVSLKGALYVREWRGKLIICKWPEKKKTRLHPKTREQMVWFKNAQKLAQYVIPQQQIIAREAAKGTPLLPRDLLTAAMAGRLWAIGIEGGRTIYSEGAAKDVSTNLDALNVVQSILVPPPPPPPTPTTEEGVSRLTKSGSDLLLSPLNGNALPIDGTNETVPSAGVSLTPAGLTINTDHFIYAFMSGGTMTLEASTTGHITDAATGVEIKSGDSTRTLVGMARPITGPAWVDTPAQRFVISWFNRRNITGQRIENNNKTWTSVPATEISTLYRVEFLTWSDDMPVVNLSCYIYMTVLLGAWVGIEAAIDTTRITDNIKTFAKALNEWLPVAPSAMPVTLTEGYHFSTMRGQVAAGVTGNSSEFYNSTLIRG